MKTSAPLNALLSVIVPLHNAGDEAKGYLLPIIEAVSGLFSDFEIVVVDNGSDAGSMPNYAALAQELPNLQIYQLISRVDFEVAAWAGVENSLGDYALVFDPLNEDLSCLSQAVSAILDGRDIVFVRNTTPHHYGAAERTFVRVFHRLFRALSGVDPDQETPHWRLLTKRVVSAILQEPRPVMRFRTLQSIGGFSKTTLSYSAPRRDVEREGLVPRLRRTVNLMLSTTMLPLRLVSMMALLGAILNLFYSGYVLVIAFVRGHVEPGWTTLSLQQSGMFFLFSVVLFVLSEYMANTLTTTRGGPPYHIVAERTSTMLNRQKKLNVEANSTVTKPFA